MHAALRRPLLVALLCLPGGACRDAYAPHEHVAAGPAPGVLRGTLELPAGSTARGECVYLVGRRSDGPGIPELVKRLPAGPFPLAFEVTARDLAGPGTLRGTWRLVARLDRDGDAPAQRGEPLGRATVEVTVAGAEVHLLLDDAVTEDSPPLPELDLVQGGHGAAPGLPAGHPMLGEAPLDPHAGHAHGPGEHGDPAAAVDEHAGHGHGPGEHDASAMPQEPAAAAASRRLPVSLELGAGAVPPPGAVLFITVRTSAEGRGMPLAVRRVNAPTFPLTVELGMDDAPMPLDNLAELFARDLWLSASLDSDGNALSKTSTDLVAGPAPAAAEGATTLLQLLPRDPP